MIEIFYCVPSAFAKGSYATGSIKLRTEREVVEWLAKACAEGAVLVTSIRWVRRSCAE